MSRNNALMCFWIFPPLHGKKKSLRKCQSQGKSLEVLSFTNLALMAQNCKGIEIPS